MTADAAQLVSRLEAIPARAGAAVRVLQLADDPDASAADVAKVIMADPVLSLKILRVANSTYYGLSGRVGTVAFAVFVIGFQAVRSIAVVTAAGLDDQALVPAEFWRVAALCATGCELVAPELGADAGDAFSVGLLHTLGSALLHQDNPPVALCLPQPDDLESLLAAEVQRHGIGHDALAAQVLRAWHFPAHVGNVIGRHHEPMLPDAPPLERTLHVARSLAHCLLRGDDTPILPDHEVTWLSQGRITPKDVPALLERMSGRAEALAEGLQPRS